MRKLLFVILFCSLVATTFAEENSAQFKAATDKVQEVLTDPQSAAFKSLRVVTNSRGEDSVCGEVNARNRFGGYTGFAKFNVSGGIVNIVDEENKETVRRYNLSGAAGAEAELGVRLEDEAFFNSNIIWAIIENVIVYKEDMEAALDAAIRAIKNRGKENGAVIGEEMLKMIRLELGKSLEQTLANKNMVKAIKKDPEYQKKMFIPTCTASTLIQLKRQTGLKQ